MTRYVCIHFINREEDPGRGGWGARRARCPTTTGMSG